MRIIHTSDWHIGCSLDGYDRSYEHDLFFKFMLNLIKEKNIDGLLISGDIFDSANPTSDSQRAFNKFLVDLRQLAPKLNIVITSGNHDSPARLSIAQNFLELHNIHLVTKLPFENDKLKIDELIVPLTDQDGKIAAYCAAIPFIRPSDIPTSYAKDQNEHSNTFVNALYVLHKQILQRMKELATHGEKLIVMDHTTVAGTSHTNEDSEIGIVIGTVESIPLNIFDGYDYVALGHIHAHQSLGENKRIVYSGSPIPLSFSEKNYRHGVEILDINNDEILVEHYPVPRTVDFITVPNKPLPIDQVLIELQKLPTNLKFNEAPFVEVQYLEKEIDSTCRTKIKNELSNNKSVRLVKITAKREDQLTDQDEQKEEILEVRDLQPVDIFSMFYKDRMGTMAEPSQELVAKFKEIVDFVKQKENI